MCVCVCVCVGGGGGGGVQIPCGATSDSFFIRLLAGLSSCYTILPLYWYSRNSFCKQSIIPHINKMGYFKTILVFQFLFWYLLPIGQCMLQQGSFPLEHTYHIFHEKIS